MRAVVIHQAGAPQQLVMEERPVPQPKPGGVGHSNSGIWVKPCGIHHAPGRLAERSISTSNRYRGRW